LSEWDRVVGKNDVPQIFDNRGDWWREPSLYLWQKSSEPRFSSPNSWRAAATHLNEVLDFFEQRGWDWKTAGRAHFNVYHDAVRKPRAGVAPISKTTWNQRVGHWMRFLRWAHDLGIIDEVPIKHQQTIRWRDGRSSTGLTERGDTESVRCLSPEYYRRFVNGLKDRRERLIADVMVATGLRISETHALTLSTLPDPTRSENRDARYLPQQIIGKGGKRRTIEWPVTLLAKVRRYAREERDDIIASAELRDPAYKDPDIIWLNVRGKPLTTRHVERVFRDASKDTGVKATPHNLRHTYATRLLGHLLRAEALSQEAVGARGGRPTAGDMAMNPLRYVQRRLGHSQISTVFVYLHLIEDVDPRVLSATDDFVGEYVA
jgi:site-specific recombinase XerD